MHIADFLLSDEFRKTPLRFIENVYNTSKKKL